MGYNLTFNSMNPTFKSKKLPSFVNLGMIRKYDCTEARRFSLSERYGTTSSGAECYLNDVELGSQLLVCCEVCSFIIIF